MDKDDTQELPALTSRRKELRTLEQQNQDIVRRFRKDLSDITSDLYSFGECLQDNRTQLSVFRGIRPIVEAVHNRSIPDSMKLEIMRLNQLTELILRENISKELKLQVELTRGKILYVLCSLG